LDALAGSPGADQWSGADAWAECLASERQGLAAVALTLADHFSGPVWIAGPTHDGGRYPPGRPDRAASRAGCEGPSQANCNFSGPYRSTHDRPGSLRA